MPEWLGAQRIVIWLPLLMIREQTLVAALAHY